MKQLGKGNFGTAFLMDDGLVWKVTVDRREYEAAQQLVGKNNEGVAKVYACTKFDNEEGDVKYLIVLEYLQMTAKGIGQKTKKRFVRCFFNSWRDYYESLPTIAQMGLSHFIDFMLLCIRKPYRMHCDNAFRYFQKQTHSAVLIALYHETCSTIVELYRQCPLLEIDLNDGNFGFTDDGHLKFFDLQRQY